MLAFAKRRKPTYTSRPYLLSGPVGPLIELQDKMNAFSKAKG